MQWMSCSSSLCDLAPQHHLFTLSSLFVPGVIALGFAILWSLESGVVLAQEDVYQVEYDGASKRNPGRAGAGALVRHPDGSVVSKFFLSLSTINKIWQQRREKGGVCQGILWPMHAVFFSVMGSFCHPTHHCSFVCTQVCELKEGLGIATNNVAEYRAFILGLRGALTRGIYRVRVQGDSKLVCEQVGACLSFPFPLLIDHVFLALPFRV